MEQLAMIEMPGGMEGRANFSPCGRYRYSLDRFWGAGTAEPYTSEVCVFIMLNPSTATAEKDDPTIRRCLGYAKAWGFCLLRVVNLFAYRATDPADLKMANGPVGRDNDAVLKASVRSGGLVIAAWGAHGAWEGRADYVVNQLLAPWSRKLQCLGTTNEGHPRHPLRLRKDLQPVPFKPTRSEQ